MAKNPGFTINVVVSGHVVSLSTTAEAAITNVRDAMTRPRSSLFGRVPEEDVNDRARLHELLSILVADLLLVGDDDHRRFQDADGQWWVFLRSTVGAIQVVDEKAGGKPPIGFRFE